MHEVKRYQALVARANYLSIDRPDIQFAVKKLATSMSNPTNCNWQELKRLGRYLKWKPRIIINYKWSYYRTEFIAYSDSDWAGCKRTAK